jgi:hypothetical protein
MMRLPMNIQIQKCSAQPISHHAGRKGSAMTVVAGATFELQAVTIFDEPKFVDRSLSLDIGHVASLPCGPQ